MRKPAGDIDLRPLVYNLFSTPFVSIDRGFFQELGMKERMLMVLGEHRSWQER